VTPDEASNYHGQVVGPTATGGRVGGGSPLSGALWFDGQDDYVQIKHTGGLDIGDGSSFAGGDFSVAAWVLLSNAEPAPTGVRVILEKRSGSSGIRGYSFHLANGRIGLQLGDGAFTNHGTPSGTVVPADGDWHLVAVTVDRSAPDGLRFYLDGEPAGPPLDPTERSGSLANDAPMRLGGNSLGPDGGNVFRGSPDEVNLVRRALTAADIAGLWRAGSSGICRHMGPEDDAGRRRALVPPWPTRPIASAWCSSPVGVALAAWPMCGSGTGSRGPNGFRPADRRQEPTRRLPSRPLPVRCRCSAARGPLGASTTRGAGMDLPGSR